MFLLFLVHFMTLKLWIHEHKQASSVCTHQQDVMPKVYWQCESHPALQIFVGLVVMCGTLFNLAVVCPVSAELSLCNLRAEGQTNMLANVYSLTSSVEGAFRLHYLFIYLFIFRGNLQQSAVLSRWKNPAMTVLSFRAQHARSLSRF